MENTEPLLSGRDAPLAGYVDYRGRQVSITNSGGWTAALFILVVDIAERFAYYGISLNLITYLTGTLQESAAEAAAAVNIWFGVSSTLPLLGAFLADCYLGRYQMIIAASLLYILGLGMLTLSTILSPFLTHKCDDTMYLATCEPSRFEVAFFYISLYLVAFAEGGHKACIQAFGADQFDQSDPEESKSRSSFFNWWYFVLCVGIVITLVVMTYVQDNIGWGLGFGIPCMAMVIALVVFLIGTKTYRLCILEYHENPFFKIGKELFIRTARTRHASSKEAEEGCLPISYQICDKETKEAKGATRLFPIWATSLIYGVVYAQSSTFFTKQGSTMDRRIGPNLKIPSAAIQSFIPLTIVIFIPIYDRAFVPTLRKLSKIPSGITMLQRIGIGMLCFVVSMVVAALVETKRLQTARDSWKVDQITLSFIPMSLWWLVPQYVLFGISDVFTFIGLQEFFYDQMPSALRGLGLALSLSIIGFGGFISSFLVSMIDKLTGKRGDSWFSDDLSHGHLDYFYWLLAMLSALGFLIYLYFAQSYVYKKRNGAI